MSAPADTHDVFLSHSAKDKASIRTIAERLQADGLKVWFDEWVLKAGDSLSSGERARVRASQIEQGLEYSQFRFQPSAFILQPFLDAPIKGSLAQFLYINWLPANHEQEYQKLLEACRPTVSAKLTDELSSAPMPQLLGDAWSGLRGLLQQAYSTKVIKGILGKAGLPIFKIKYTGTYKGPVLDEADILVASMNLDARGHFVTACIHEILAVERTKAANLSEHGTKPDDKTVNDLRVVLARFGHDLRRFEPT